MKKALSLILALVMCLSLCACGESNNANTESNSDLILYDKKTGCAFIDQERIHEILTIVDLSTENWHEYLEVCTYSNEIVEKDAFGEIVSIKTNTFHRLGAKENQYYQLHDFVIELKNKESGEIELYEGYDGGLKAESEVFNLDRYECMRIKGTLYLIDLPEEVIIQMEDGRLYFLVGYKNNASGSQTRFFIDQRLVTGFSLSVV